MTQLIDLLDKPGLLKWANKLGLQGINIDDKRKRSLERGSSMHKQVEAVVLGTGTFEREIDAMSFAEFRKHCEIKEVEQAIETEWFVGRYDALVSVAGEDYIVDFKGGYKGKLYLDYKLQLVAYTMARPAKMAVVPTPSFHFIPVEIADRRPYERMLICLSELWALKKEIEQ